jgi:glycosyltransferase involved in cell wall biosynthesis
MTTSARILHVLPSFELGGTQSRVAQIINAFGDRLNHTILALDNNFGADGLIDSRACVRFLSVPKSAHGPLQLTRLITTSRPDLLLTYNWGAMDAVVAGLITKACPIIHSENGFGVDEVVKLKLRRVLARRALLNRIYTTVVPSYPLEAVARNRYRIRRDKLRLILNGVDTQRFAPRRNMALRRDMGVADDCVLFGYVGQLRSDKNLGFLLWAFSQIAIPGRKLAFIGDGPCRPDLEAIATNLGLADAVCFVGAVNDPAPYYNALDAFVLPSLTEQTSMALIEAMACGLPAVCTAVGDVRSILGETPVRPVSVGDEPGFVRAMGELAEHENFRRACGEANRERCLASHSSGRMLAEYAALYLGALRESQRREFGELPSMAPVTGTRDE